MLVSGIPFAPGSFAETRPPLRILHVVTDLMHKPESAGFNAEAHATMMRAVGSRVGPRGEFDHYEIHAPDHP